MTLDKKLARLRKREGLSQAEVSEALDVSRQAVTKWETGTSRPSIENLQSLSRLYNVPLEYLLDESGDELPAPAPAAPAAERAPEQKVQKKEKQWMRLLVIGAVVLALLVSYVNIVQENTEEMLNFTLTSPTVLVGMFIGAMLTFVFSAFTMSAVQKAAQSIVVEVRRQFKEIAGIMEYKADPDYASCVSLCTKGALHEMVVPALLAIIVPLATGLVLGPTGVVGLLGGVSVTGFAMAVFMSNAGGAWDNAKKYIEGGHHGGKGSECHKAAVVGDTVGDPFKDTSGPSLNILIKLCSTVSIVFSGLILAFNLMNLL